MSPSEATAVAAARGTYGLPCRPGGKVTQSGPPERAADATRETTGDGRTLSDGIPTSPARTTGGSRDHHPRGLPRVGAGGDAGIGGGGPAPGRRPPVADSDPGLGVRPRSLSRGGLTAPTSCRSILRARGLVAARRCLRADGSGSPVTD